jgi:hypothetical protein
MLTAQANIDRTRRYDRWYQLLRTPRWYRRSDQRPDCGWPGGDEERTADYVVLCSKASDCSRCLSVSRRIGFPCELAHPLTITVSGLLDSRGIQTRLSARSEVSEPGHVAIHPATELCAPIGSWLSHSCSVLYTPGGPGGQEEGFIPIDVHRAVQHLERVWAAGDATDFPIEHGVVAARSADIAAQATVAVAGADVEPSVPSRDPRDTAGGRQAPVPRRRRHRQARLVLGDQRDVHLVAVKQDRGPNTWRPISSPASRPLYGECDG